MINRRPRTTRLRRAACALIAASFVAGPLAADAVDAAPDAPSPRPPREAAPAANVDPPGPPPDSPADPARPITDVALLQAMRGETAVEPGANAEGGKVRPSSRRGDAAPPTEVGVEVLTAYDVTVSARVVELGGEVIGQIDGQLVQAVLPVAAVDDLALSDGVTYVRSPQRVNQRPGDRQMRTDFGPVNGSHVAITNADDWHAAGIDGTGVKVGIVDYFITTIWNPAEQGPKPTIANGHEFCLDTSVFAEFAPLCLPNGSIDPAEGDDHGLQVAEVVKDMAPGAELYIASVGTRVDLQAAIDWFALNGVTIITRSLSSEYDGPGDGTGPLASVVDYAASKGITWFNSAGNSAVDEYMRFTVPSNLGDNQYVDFNDTNFTSGGNPVTDTWLRLDGECIWLDGVRWSDWALPAAQRTNYQLEFYETASYLTADHANPTSAPLIDWPLNPYNDNQTTGALPLEAADYFICPANFFGPFDGVSYLRIKKLPSATDLANTDTLEIRLASGLLEVDYYDTAGSTAGSVADSANPALVSVGAVDPPAGSAIAFYSSQGPTNDGRIKPDISAPAGFSTSFGTFNGTSASSPAAAGAAALLLDADAAVSGAPLADLLEHLVVDLGTPGPDNAFGAGKILLPTPPTTPSPTENVYQSLASTTRILNTRTSDPVGPSNLRGPYARGAVLDLPVLGVGGVPSTNVTAVAITVTSVDTTSTGYVQALPTLQGRVGATSTLNVSVVGAARPNFAVVPVGMGGAITLYLHAGGNVIVDVQGYFTPAASSTPTAGRYVPIDPERWTDTRDVAQLPVYGNGNPSGDPRLVNAAETMTAVIPGTTAVPATGVAALVVNVTGTNAVGNGFLRALPAGASGTHSTVNVRTGSASASGAIVPLGTGGTIGVYAHSSMDVIIDVVGYITDGTAAASAEGKFVPVTPGRNYDSRLPSPNPFAAGENRLITLVGQVAPAAVVPATASAVSVNLTVSQPSANGWLKVYPSTEPTTTTLNYAANRTVANGTFSQLDANGQVNAKLLQTGHVIIDVNGYFTGPT